MCLLMCHTVKMLADTFDSSRACNVSSHCDFTYRFSMSCDVSYSVISLKYVAPSQAEHSLR